MSFQTMTWAVDQDLPTNQKMVLIMLANRTNHDTGRCDPSHKRLAKDCGMSLSTLKRCLSALEEEGYIGIVTRRSGDVNLPNQYQLNMTRVGSERTDPSSQGTDHGSHGPEGVGSERATNHEVNNHEVNHEEKPKGHEAEIPEWVPAEQWADFVEHRKQLKAKLTDRAVKMAIKELAKLRDAGHEPAAVLEQSIVNGWKGVFPIKGGNVHPFPGRPRPQHSNLDQANNHGLTPRADGTYSL